MNTCPHNPNAEWYNCDRCHRNIMRNAALTPKQSQRQFMIAALTMGAAFALANTTPSPYDPFTILAVICFYCLAVHKKWI